MTTPKDEDEATIDAGTTRLAPTRAKGAPAVGTRLGQYPVRGVLGTGGMGQVLEVVDPSLGRVIAAKVVLGHADAAARAKFVQEAQVTGQLEHPNIVPIYELAADGTGPLYYTMKRVQGETLDELLAGRDGPGGASLPRLLSVFAKVCDAIAYAHDRGVIHRDLKPANIMVGQFGEVLVMDWGLAKLLARTDDEPAAVATRPHGGETSAQTLDGQIMGTPYYMPPEQAAGEIDKLDPRSDVYSLGAILYEIVTGQRPFDGPTPWAVLDLVRDGKLVPPSRRAPAMSIPWELEAVVLRAMAFEREHRYAGATELKADVEAFLEGRLLAAARYTVGQRVLKWGQRHRGVVATIAAATIVAIVLGTMAVVRIAREHAVALANERTAIAARDSAQASLAETERARARVALQLDLRDYSRHIAETRMCFYIPTLDPVKRVAELETMLAELERRLAADPAVASHPDVHSLVGVGWYHLSCSSRAEAALLRAHALAPDDGWVNYYLARIYAERSLLVLNSSTDLKRILRESDAWAREAGKYFEGDSPDLRDIDRHQLKVLRAMTTGHPDEARRLAEEGIKTYDKVMGVEDFHAAIGYCAVSREQVVAILQNQQDLTTLMLAGKLVQAVIDGWTRALEIRPHYAWAYYARGFANNVIGQKRAALHDFGRAVQIAPSMPEGHSALAVVHQQEGRADQAMAELDLAIQLGPRTPLFLVNRAALWLARRDVERAIEDYSRAIELDPSDVSALSGRAVHRMRRGEDALALVDFSRLIDIDPESVWALNHRATLRERAGDLAGALEDFARAAAAPPLRWEPAKRHGLFLARVGRRDAARAELERARELAPEKERAAISKVIDELAR